MSRGGASIGSGRREETNAGQHAGKLLREIVRSGKSFSGRERNCCFLNTGKTRWANVSAASGLAEADDSRAVAITDWDFDGDLDLWVVNRSGPQVRFFRNDLGRKNNSFVTFQLTGVESNRDAIGARVMLQLSNPKRTQIKTVRAGDGYLSQSSKIVHFGVPDKSSIEAVTIRWPAGTEQRFAAVESGRHYQIAEGGELKPRVIDNPAVNPNSTVPLAANLSTANRVLLAEPIPLPRLSYKTYDGNEKSLEPNVGHHQLISLWATWCAPCISELSNLAEHADQLRNANVNVVALCVDELDASNASSHPAQALDQIKFPFESGDADRQTIDILQIVNNHLFDLHRPLPLPCSFLLDPDGNLAAVYKGPVKPDQLLRDVAQTGGSSIQRRTSSLPFPGKWDGPPRRSRILMLAMSMLEAGLPDETLEFVNAEQRALSADREFDVLLFNIGQQFTRAGNHNKAAKLYQQAIAINPKLGSAHYNLAITFLQAGDHERASFHLEQTVALEPNSPDALRYLGRIAIQRGQAPKALGLLEKALALRPNHAETHFQIAVASALSGELDRSVKRYRSAVAWEPAKYSDKVHNSRIVAALESAFSKLQSAGPTTSSDLSRWRAAISRVRKMRQ